MIKSNNKKLLIKILFFLILILLINDNLFSQPYQSIFGSTSASWKIVASNIDIMTTDSVRIEGDTVFNSLNYKKIICDYPTCCGSLTGFLREDTIEGKVWYYSLSDTTERLIMNLSLTINDSIYFQLWPDTGWIKVDSVYYILGKKYVQLNTTVNPYGWGGWGEKLLYIEGIGTNRGIQYLAANTFNDSPYLLCSYKDSLLVYSNTNLNFNGCYLLNPDVIENFNYESYPVIFPNPISEKGTLKFNNSNNSQFIIIIFDLSGNKISQFNSNTSIITINGEYFKQGIYFYKLYNVSNSISFFGKLIFIKK